jgi:DNA-binding transcriptional LysR family regulator
MLKSTLAKAGIAPHIAYETDDLDFMTSLVAQGRGICFTPEFVVRQSQPSLKTFSVSEVSFNIDAVLAWAARLRDVPTLRSFVAFVTSQPWPQPDAIRREIVVFEGDKVS